VFYCTVIASGNLSPVAVYLNTSVFIFCCCMLMYKFVNVNLLLCNQLNARSHTKLQA